MELLLLTLPLHPFIFLSLFFFPGVYPMPYTLYSYDISPQCVLFGLLVIVVGLLLLVCIYV